MISMQQHLVPCCQNIEYKNRIFEDLGQLQKKKPKVKGYLNIEPKHIETKQNNYDVK